MWAMKLRVAEKIERKGAYMKASKQMVMSLCGHLILEQSIVVGYKFCVPTFLPFEAVI